MQNPIQLMNKMTSSAKLKKKDHKFMYSIYHGMWSSVVFNFMSVIFILTAILHFSSRGFCNRCGSWSQEIMGFN